MKLILQNGYLFPFPPQCGNDDAASEAAGETRLELAGVRHFQWLHTVTVEFTSERAFQAAQELTGWREWSYHVLEAQVSVADGYGHPAILARGLAYCGFMLDGA